MRANREVDLGQFVNFPYLLTKKQTGSSRPETAITNILKLSTNSVATKALLLLVVGRGAEKSRMSFTQKHR